MRSQENRMMTLILDEGGPIIVWEDKAPNPLHRKLLIITRICDNPECDCRDVWVNGVLIDDRYTDLVYHGDRLSYVFKPGEGEPSEPPPLRQLYARVDVDSGEVGFSPRAPAKLHDPELLGWLKEGLDRSHMDTIRKRWRLAKGINRDQWRSRDWSWWQPGDMVYWQEVFPDDINILFKLGNDTYWADDMYCINPGCGCQEVGLVLYRLTKGKTENVGSISVTLPSGKFSSFLEENGNGNLLRRLWDLLRQDKGRCALLKKRKKDIVPVGREIVRLSAGKAAVRSNSLSGKGTSVFSLKKVGRNDPCPCGSGKKYKKCCLGKT